MPGNNMFHLITAEGKQQMSKLGLSANEVDFYFAVELNLSGDGGSGAGKTGPECDPEGGEQPRFRQTHCHGGRLAYQGSRLAGPPEPDPAIGQYRPTAPRCSIS